MLVVTILVNHTGDVCTNTACAAGTAAQNADENNYATVLDCVSLISYTHLQWRWQALSTVWLSSLHV